MHQNINKIESDNLSELNTIIKISQKIISTLSLDEILQTICDGMSELLSIETAAIYFLENSPSIFLMATTPALESNTPDFVRRSLLSHHPNIKKAIDSQKPHVLYVKDSPQLTQEEQIVVELRNINSCLYLPFVKGNEVLGILLLSTSNSSRKYTDREITMAQSLANQLSVAIQNTKLHNELTNYKDHLEMLVQEKTEELSTAIEELKATNEELYAKNDLIFRQNAELKSAMEELKLTQAQLINSEKIASIGNLTAGVAHEINNPLNYIVGSYYGLMEYFEDNGSKDKDKTDFLLSTIKIGVDRASSIVKGLCKLNQTSSKLKEPCDIHEVLDNCLMVLSNKIENIIEIKKAYSKDIPLILCRIGDIHQVFISILMNSILSIEKEGTVILHTSKNAKELMVHIEDTGCGISEINISKVFEPFFTTRDPGKGVGLGLSIANAVVKDHAGRIIIQSTPNVGTSVRVYLPLNTDLDN